jgi:cation transport ATPase
LAMIAPQIRAMAMLLMQPVIGQLTWHGLLLWILVTPVQFGVGAQFYKSAWSGHTHTHTHTHTLIHTHTHTHTHTHSHTLIHKHTHTHTHTHAHTGLVSSTAAPTWLSSWHLAPQPRTSTQVNQCVVNYIL